MAPEILPPENFDPRIQGVENVMDRLAQNTAMQTIARISMIIVAALFLPFCGISGWVAVRIITTIDKIIDQQAALNDRYIALKTEYTGKMQLLDLTDLHLDAKLTETDNRINKRIDTVSERNQRNAADIDNLKEKVYPLLPRR